MLLSTKKLLSISLLNFNHLEILNKLLPKKLQFAVFLKTGDKKNVKYIKGFNKTYEFPFRTKFQIDYHTFKKKRAQKRCFWCSFMFLDSNVFLLHLGKPFINLTTKCTIFTSNY